MKKYRIITKTHDWWSNPICLAHPEVLLIYPRFIDYYIVQKRRRFLFWKWDNVNAYSSYYQASLKLTELLYGNTNKERLA